LDKCPARAYEVKDSDILNMFINVVSSLAYLSSTTQDTTIYSYFEKYLFDENFSELKAEKNDYVGLNAAIDWHRRSTSLDNIASTGTDNSALFFENLLNYGPSEKTSLIMYLGKTRNSKAVRVLEKLYYDDKTENSIKYIILSELSRMKREDANEIVIRLYSDYLKTNLPRLDSYGYDKIMNNIRGIANFTVIN
jgi:uncharacterized membrane protein YheB (UPF0754 family)